MFLRNQRFESIQLDAALADRKMSYYFCIVGTKDNPLFELEFGTSKQGGDGVARFPAEARRLNPFVVHASIDIVEEMQWLSNQMYARYVEHRILRHANSLGISSGLTVSLPLISPAISRRHLPSSCSCICLIRPIPRRLRNPLLRTRTCSHLSHRIRQVPPRLPY